MRSGLPVSDHLPHPPRRLLYGARPVSRWLVRRRFAVRVHHGGRVPARGGVILASNHIGWSDGPLLAAFSPRPVHVLGKSEMFTGALGVFLRAAGQVPLRRFEQDPRAVRTCLRVLRAGGVVGVFPEGRRGAGDLTRFHRGAAYLALVTGAPVVPVAMLGTRAPGGSAGSIPGRGDVVDLTYGEPVRLERTEWPRTREQVAASSLLIRRHMLALVEEARVLTGRDLPGPMPAGQLDDDPHTGLVLPLDGLDPSDHSDHPDPYDTAGEP